MSSLTTCNYCDLKALKSRAEREGKILKVTPSDFQLGGKEIYLLPSEETEPTDQHWVTWMLEIPDHCVC